MGPAGPGGPVGPMGPGSPQFWITTSRVSSPEVIFTIQVDGNSEPIHLNPPVAELSTVTVLLGLILITTLWSRGRRTRPTMTSSPRVMFAVVINISARALPGQIDTKLAMETMVLQTSFEAMANFPLSFLQKSSGKFTGPNSVTSFDAPAIRGRSDAPCKRWAPSIGKPETS